MNLYIRYFDNETLVHNVEEALQFLRSLGEITVTRNMEADIREYAASNVMFPKRYKVRAHVYFIIIKTTAATMRDFKEKKAMRPSAKGAAADNPIARLSMRRDGWYEGDSTDLIRLPDGSYAPSSVELSMMDDEHIFVLYFTSNGERTTLSIHVESYFIENGVYYLDNTPDDVTTAINGKIFCCDDPQIVQLIREAATGN